jgi:ABC-type multidrug transport system ATPase subunit
MRIELEGLGKRYRRHWIFRNLSTVMEAPQRWALTGPNGSGKSTLIRLLAGALVPGEGRLCWSLEGRELEPEVVFTQVALAAPYLELLEPLALGEFLDFHGALKPWREGMDSRAVMQRCGLEEKAGQAIREFSSGMKQRVRLACALYSHCPLLLLDEPGSNLDASGRRWMEEELEACSAGRLIVIASNLEEEVRTCTCRIDLGAAAPA